MIESKWGVYLPAKKRSTTAHTVHSELTSEGLPLGVPADGVA